MPINDFHRIFTNEAGTAGKQDIPENFMRAILIGLAALACLVSGMAQAKQRLFIVANDADGYGIDRCLASGEKYGAAAANAYCRTQAFAAATKYHKVGPDDLTGAATEDTSATCQPGTCEIVAIVCLR